jgi:hypothetical protein
LRARRAFPEELDPERFPEDRPAEPGLREGPDERRGAAELPRERPVLERLGVAREGGLLRRGFTLGFRGVRGEDGRASLPRGLDRRGA